MTTDQAVTNINNTARAALGQVSPQQAAFEGWWKGSEGIYWRNSFITAEGLDTTRALKQLVLRAYLQGHLDAALADRARLMTT